MDLEENIRLSWKYYKSEIMDLENIMNNLKNNTSPKIYLYPENITSP